MNERDFVTTKREGWERLSLLVAKANAPRGIRNLSREDLLQFGALYRRASSDLAYAQAHATSDDLVQHLNSIVGSAHALLYEAETSGNPARSIIHFYGVEFPLLLQRHFRYFLVAMAVFFLGMFVAYWLVIEHPDKLDMFIPPQFKSSVEAWKSGKVSAGPQAEMSSYLMTNNYRVGIIAFATGIVAGVPTADMLFQNGATLGALAALMTQVHHHDTLWPGILPHATAELTGIFICGAAGFLLGMALLFPGTYSRRDALRLAGLDAIKLVIGTIPLFVFAGIIEGMFSHLDLHPAIRYAFAGTNGVIWYLYLFLPRNRTVTFAGPPQSTELEV